MDTKINIHKFRIDTSKPQNYLVTGCDKDSVDNIIKYILNEYMEHQCVIFTDKPCDWVCKYYIYDGLTRLESFVERMKKRKDKKPLLIIFKVNNKSLSNNKGFKELITISRHLNISIIVSSKLDSIVISSSNIYYPAFHPCTRAHFHHVIIGKINNAKIYEKELNRFVKEYIRCNISKKIFEIVNIVYNDKLWYIDVEENVRLRTRKRDVEENGRLRTRKQDVDADKYFQGIEYLQKIRDVQQQK